MNYFTWNSIIYFIEQTFSIEVFSVIKLNILSEVHNAFKVCVRATVRDKLFDGEKWPEDIIVNKFYNKRTRKSSRTSTS